MTTDSPRSADRFYVEIFMIAAAVILLEITYTRIFSFKVFYYFTYLIIGIALLGIGSGGALVALSRSLRDMRVERLVPLLCAIAGASVPIGYLAVARIQLNVSDLTSHILIETPKLLAICTALFIPFLLGGVAIASIFAARPQRINRLYFADLLGAGAGCMFVVYLMQALTPPGTVVCTGLLFSIAALPMAWRQRRQGIITLAIATSAASLAAIWVPALLPDPIPDKNKELAPQKMGASVELLHSEWSPVFRVDVKQSSTGPLAGIRFLVHDGIVGSSIAPWDGESAPSWVERDRGQASFRLLGPDPSVLIIGAAGGREVQAALAYGAGEVVAVELNPVTVSLMRDKFAAYSGHVMDHDRVTLINGEGRSILSRMDRPFDLIWLVAPDSYAAMNSATAGAFVLSESYLYTVEMAMEALRHLGEQGILCAQFGDIDFLHRPKRTARYLVTIREALRRLGVEEPDEHVLLATSPDFPWPASSILVKRTPFSTEQVQVFRETVARLDRLHVKSHPEAATEDPGDPRHHALVWHAAAEGAGARAGHLATLPLALEEHQLGEWLETTDYRLSAVTDNQPFFWHFVGFKDAISGEWGIESPVWDPEEATGERVLVVLLVVAVMFGAMMTFLPIAMARRAWNQLPCKRYSFVYFTALGLGFMFFEISLIQQLTLFLGYPTYSLTVTLFAILASTATGSLLSERFGPRRGRALLILLGALGVLAGFYQLLMAPLLGQLSGLPIAVRIAVTILLVFPLGAVLGAFMPLGLAAVSNLTPHGQQYVAWSWAVNGFASVVASVLATMASMTFGFARVQTTAVIIYGIGVGAMLLVLQRAPVDSHVIDPSRS